MNGFSSIRRFASHLLGFLECESEVVSPVIRVQAIPVKSLHEKKTDFYVRHEKVCEKVNIYKNRVPHIKACRFLCVSCKIENLFKRTIAFTTHGVYNSYFEKT